MYWTCLSGLTPLQSSTHCPTVIRPVASEQARTQNIPRTTRRSTRRCFVGRSVITDIAETESGLSNERKIPLFREIFMLRQYGKQHFGGLEYRWGTRHHRHFAIRYSCTILCWLCYGLESLQQKLNKTPTYVVHVFQQRGFNTTDGNFQSYCLCCTYCVEAEDLNFQVC